MNDYNPAGLPALGLATLSITIDGQGREASDLASVVINGRSVEMARLNGGGVLSWSGDLQPGSYIVSTRAQGHRPIVRTLELTVGTEEGLRYTLRQLEEQPWGELTEGIVSDTIRANRPDIAAQYGGFALTVDTPGARALLDGVDMGGASPFTRTNLPPGTYMLDVLAPNKIAQHLNVQVRPGAPQALHVVLESAPTGAITKVTTGTPSAVARRATIAFYATGAVAAALAVIIAAATRR